MLKKKSLGQHFLNSKHYLGMIVDAADIQVGEWVLEVGPGEGTLTEELLSRGARVVAIEKDSRLIPVLQTKFEKEITEKKFFLYEEDILALDLKKVGLEKHSYKVVANIPYYITGAILKNFLSEKNQPADMVLLVQKEVAERIARDKKESILSLSVKAYGKVKYIKTVPAGAFSPPPNVDSAILLISDISRKNFGFPDEEKRFFELVKTGFAQKRKLLASNIKTLLGTEYVEMLQKAGIPEKARAEDVPLEKWLILSGMQH